MGSGCGEKAKRQRAQYMMGQLHEARKALLHVLASRDILEQGPGGFGHDPYFTAVPTLLHVEWALGYPQTALDRSAEHLPLK